MHENITKALENQVRLESIELESQELMQSAGIFSEVDDMGDLSLMDTKLKAFISPQETKLIG
jgi:hypothetical protein